MRVLVIDDDRAVRDAVRRAFTLEGYEALTADGGLDGLQRVDETRPDVIVLDVMMPDVDGLEVCRRLRSAGDRTPILMLTARDAVSDRIDGLDAGADDYLMKPFDLDELAARVRAALRRRTGQKQPVYAHGGLTLDPASHEARKDGVPLPLVPREFALLQVLIEEPARVFRRAELEEKLYGWGEEVGSNTIEVHVHSLRRKIGAEQILTVRGVGYRLKGLE